MPFNSTWIFQGSNKVRDPLQRWSTLCFKLHSNQKYVLVRYIRKRRFRIQNFILINELRRKKRKLEEERNGGTHKGNFAWTLGTIVAVDESYEMKIKLHTANRFSIKCTSIYPCWCVEHQSFISGFDPVPACNSRTMIGFLKRSPTKLIEASWSSGQLACATSATTLSTCGSIWWERSSIIWALGGQDSGVSKMHSWVFKERYCCISHKDHKQMTSQKCTLTGELSDQCKEEPVSALSHLRIIDASVDL